MILFTNIKRQQWANPSHSEWTIKTAQNLVEIGWRRLDIFQNCYFDFEMTITILFIEYHFYRLRKPKYPHGK